MSFIYTLKNVMNSLNRLRMNARRYFTVFLLISLIYASCWYWYSLPILADMLPVVLVNGALNNIQYLITAKQ